MARRKSVCTKWTLILLIVLVCPFVHTRPQETSVKTVLSTESSIRYSFRNSNLSLRSLFEVISLNNSQPNRTNVDVDSLGVDFTKNPNITNSERNMRSIRRYSLPNTNGNNKISSTNKHRNKVSSISANKPKPAIRKVVTKWKDKTSYDDLNFNLATTSDEKLSTTEDSSEINKVVSSDKNLPYNYFTAAYEPNYQRPQHHQMQVNQIHMQPQPPHHQMQVYSDNIQLVDYHTPQPFIPSLHTHRPTPTPIITNVGYPQPWQQNPHIYEKPTVQKPVHVTKPLNYNYHNSIHNYPGNFEVTTFQPTSAYTERIVIRPEEYSGSPDECPTIFLTLNNTFQGKEGKEACPDLNIAVNTNVINKNNIVETEEEDEDDSIFPAGFGLPTYDDSSSTPEDSNEGNGESLDEQDESQAESASVEESELSNYQAANLETAESAEPGYAASPTHQSISRPGRPSKDEEDVLGFSQLIEFFRPALGALGWLTSANPFAIGLFPLFLTPLAFLFAGTGLASLFTPFFYPLGREAPKIVHVDRPYWHWDDKIKTWHLHSFPDNRRWRESRDSKESREKSSIKPTLFYRLKEFMKLTTKMLKDRDKSLKENEKKRKKREIWTLRVK